jgi:hypothetical protein
MILNASETHLISHLGWVDKGGVWLCEAEPAQVRRVALSEARYLTLRPGRGDLFSAIHHSDSDRLAISAHRIDSPDEAISRILIDASGPTFEGDCAVWSQLPRAYVAYYARAFQLFLIAADPPSVELQQFDWYDDSYDRSWQGVIGVVEVPGSDLLIVSVQRDSSPVLYDPRTRTAVRKISLAGRGGNPTLRFRRTAPELWADDYDALLRLDPRDWSILDAIRVQDAAGGNAQLFIGGYAFNPAETLCAVARPYSGDVVALDTTSFKITHSVAVAQQPLDVALLSDGRVFARDWKTGDLLQGILAEQ